VTDAVFVWTPHDVGALVLGVFGVIVGVGAWLHGLAARGRK
jgi:hypothetical protein